MSEEVEKSPEQLEAEELNSLKRRANTLGLPFSPNIGLSTLRERVNNALAVKSGDDEEEAGSVKEVRNTAPKGETKNQRKARLRKIASHLFRVRITNLNPAKREHEGELFKASNSVVGTHTRYVQFNEDWHVERILLNMIEERKYQQFYTTSENGKKVRRSRLVREFGIEYLAALTPKQLDDLRKAQALRDGKTDD